MKHFILSLILLSFISCSNVAYKGSTKKITPADQSYLVYRGPASFWDIFKTTKQDYSVLTEVEKDALPSIVEESHVWREKAYLYYNILQKYQHSKPLNSQEQQLLIALKHTHQISINNKEVRPLTSFLIKNLHRTFGEYREIYDEIESIVNAGEWVFKKNYEITVREDQPTGEDKEAWHKYQQDKIFNDDNDEDFVQPFYINPTDEKGRELIYKIKRALAAGLLFYDNFNYAIHFYQKDKKLRKMLNYDNEDNYKFLAKVTKYFHSFTYFRRMGDAIDLYEDLQRFHTKRNLSYTEFEKLENDIIESSMMFKIFDQISTFSRIGDKFEYYGQVLNMTFSHAGDVTTNSLSQVFGNGVGQFASRPGKLTALSPKERASITSQLQPLDILFEKTPFRLTDKFIPGHFGHAAVWVGNKKQLKEIGIWNDPLVVPYHKLIEEGHSIVEALRPGVQINSFDHFLNIDDLAAIRLKDKLAPEVTKRYLLNAFAQIGKDYDFNFDVETDKTIVCSELVYVVYDDMVWPTEKSVGRYTISPDNVAAKAGEGQPFKIVLIYHDGKPIQVELEENFSRLLKGEYQHLKFK